MRAVSTGPIDDYTVNYSRRWSALHGARPFRCSRVLCGGPRRSVARGAATADDRQNVRGLPLVRGTL